MNWKLIESVGVLVKDGGDDLKQSVRVHIQAKTVDDMPEPKESWAVGSTCFVESPHKWFTLGLEREWV